jgi:dTDP-4-dehydrorhamnose 3,5-epimerase-like enzyme
MNTTVENKPLGEIINLKIMGDDRGSLIALEKFHNVPFDIKRVYYIFNTKDGVKRGFHAHKKLKQLAICVCGNCKFMLNNGKNKKEFILDSPDKGLMIEGLVWREIYDFSSDCVLMVLADSYYDKEDYIRDYDKFIQISDRK